MLDELVGGPAGALTAVALVVAPGARASGWGAQAADELAQRWRGPRRVLLADLDIERPSLHEAAGVPNDEGVIDLIEYGISLGRLIQPGRSGAYDFIPAGLFTPEPGAILRHEGWARVLLEVAARRGTLLAWVPAEADGMDAVVERAGAVLVLADDADEGRAVVERLPHPYAVLAVLVPESAVAPDHAAEADATAESDVADRVAAAAGAALLAEDAPAAESDLVPEDASAAEAGIFAADARAAEADLVAEYQHLADADLVAEAEHVAEADAREAVTAALSAEVTSFDDDAPSAQDEPPADTTFTTDEAPSAQDEPPADTTFTTDASPPADADLLEHDPAAREALAEEIRERQRAARIAGAAAAAGVFGAASAAAARTGAPAEDLDSPPARAIHDDSDLADIDAAGGEIATGPGIEAAGLPSGVDKPVPADLPDGDLAMADPPDAHLAIADLSDGNLEMAEPSAELSAAELAMADAVSGSPVPVPAGPQARDQQAPAAESPAPRQRIGASASPPLRKPQRRKFSHPLLWTVGVVLLMSLLAGAWHFLGGRLGPVEPSVTAPAPEPEPPPAASVAQDALPFVVAIEAHREITAALTRVTDLTEIEPELLFHIESVERDGTLFYHVMAGPVADSATALALRDTLIARGHKTGATPTDVRTTPLAFLIGDYGTSAAAGEQGEVLRRLDIPGYVLQGEAVDGQPLYRLYVGGFATEAESDVVGQMLRAAGIRDSLVTRTGSLSGAAPFALPGDSTMAGDSLVTPTDSSNP